MSGSGRKLPVFGIAHHGVAMERFVHNANIERYQKLLAESERDPLRDENRHKVLKKLLAEELAKEKEPRDN